MIKTIGLLALMACFCASADITVTRDGSTDWICADADGVPLSNHTRIDKAFEACTNRTLADGLVYRVVAGSTYAIQSDGVVIPPDPVDSDGDGVNDDVDQCPGTTQGVEVDAAGCEVVVIPPATGALADCLTYFATNSGWCKLSDHTLSEVLHTRAEVGDGIWGWNGAKSVVEAWNGMAF